MRRRLDLAASLVGNPRVLYLDEPTTGLDPRSRTDVWGMVRDLVADGVTVLLTTQYLDEADQLAHDIVVFDHGRVVATGTPDELKAKTEGQVLHVAPSDPLAGFPGGSSGQSSPANVATGTTRPAFSASKVSKTRNWRPPTRTGRPVSSRT